MGDGGIVTKKKESNRHTYWCTQVRSSESLLILIKELKQFLLLNDTKTLTTLTEQRSIALSTQTAEIKNVVQDLRKDVAAAIYDMESVYYRSLTD
jgi:hypothetical protein